MITKLVICMNTDVRLSRPQEDLLQVIANYHLSFLTYILWTVVQH